MKLAKVFFLFLMCLSTWALELQNIRFYQEQNISKVDLIFDGDISSMPRTKSSDSGMRQVYLDFSGVTASPEALKGIDTSEFPGESVYITVNQKTESMVRLMVQLRSNVQSRMLAEGNKIVLEIEGYSGAFTGKKQKIAKSKSKSKKKKSSSKATEELNNYSDGSTSGKKYAGRKISINVSGMKVSELLKIIAEASDFNIIVNETEVDKAPPVTLKLLDTPWDQVLDTVMNLSHLVAKRMGNILTVTSFEQFEKEQLAKIKQEEESKKLEPLVTKIFPISYAKIEDMEKLITPYITKDRGSVQMDKRTNYLIVQDTEKVVQVVERLLKELDEQTPQVMIEGKIVEVTDSFSREMGLENGIGTEYSFAKRPTVAPTGGFTFDSTGGAAGGATGLLGLVITNVSRLVNLNFQLKLLETQNKAKIITSPKLITKHKEKAHLLNSETRNISVNMPNANGQLVPTLQAVKADIRLDVTPQVTNEGAINLEIDISKSDFTSNEKPDTLSNSVQTSVLVDNGNTLMIGGLYKTTDKESHRGVPFLKDIPLLGWLFRSKYNPSTGKSELIVFITPTILNAKAPAALAPIARGLSSE